MADSKKYPAPTPNPETAAFWDAAKQGRFMIKRCTACGEPPVPWAMARSQFLTCTLGCASPRN